MWSYRFMGYIKWNNIGVSLYVCDNIFKYVSCCDDIWKWVD